MSPLDTLALSASHMPEQIPNFLILLTSRLFIFKKIIRYHFNQTSKKWCKFLKIANIVLIFYLTIM